MRLLREGYSERLFLLTDERGQTIVRKQAKPGIEGTLRAEIAWLEELPASLRRYFPRVLRTSHPHADAEPVFYDMPYFGQGWTLLSDLILTQTLNQERTVELIAQVMRIMFGGIFPTTYPEEEHAYADRLIVTLERSIRQILRIPALSPLLSSEVITINGAKLWNVFPLLHLIKRNGRLRRKLRSVGVRKVHGDLYPDNILVYVPSLVRTIPQVVLLDPLAPLGVSRGDFTIDIAKFISWLSAELLMLRLGLFSIYEQAANSPTFGLHFRADDVQLSALSDGVLLREFTRLLATADWARAVCDPDPDWWQRVSFYEALYALSMVPLVSFPQSLARFLVGVQHLHRFVCGLSDQPSAAGSAGTCGMCDREGRAVSSSVCRSAPCRAPQARSARVR